MIEHNDLYVNENRESAVLNQIRFSYKVTAASGDHGKQQDRR